MNISQYITHHLRLPVRSYVTSAAHLKPVRNTTDYKYYSVITRMILTDCISGYYIRVTSCIKWVHRIAEVQTTTEIQNNLTGKLYVLYGLITIRVTGYIKLFTNHQTDTCTQVTESCCHYIHIFISCSHKFLNRPPSVIVRPGCKVCKNGVQ